MFKQVKVISRCETITGSDVTFFDYWDTRFSPEREQLESLAIKTKASYEAQGYTRVVVNIEVTEKGRS